MKQSIGHLFLLAVVMALLIPCVAKTQNCNLIIEVPEDTALCNQGLINLNGKIMGDYLNFHWSGSNGYYNNQVLNPAVLVSGTTTFTLATEYLSTTNLITNGGFEAGATGFTTQYALSFPGYTCPSGNQVWGLLGCEGTYFVGPSSSAVHTNFANCTPHSGNKMMMLNGASSLQKLWCQTITVVPNTDYVFQAFATSIESSSPAILQFAINGTLLGAPFALSNSTCNWQEFYQMWNSGSNTSIEICITNQNTAGGGNDFAIDDIFFGPLCKDSMDFTVYVSELELQSPEDGYIDCTAPVTSLEVTALPAGGNYVYAWNTSNGTIESDTTQALIQVSAAGLYQVTVTDELGCSKTKSANVDANLDLPEIEISGDNEISCEEPAALLSALASEMVNEFTWTLPDGGMQTGKDLTTTQPGWHFVSATNAYGCTGVDSFFVEQLNTQFVYDVQVSGPLTCKDTVQWIEINIESLYDSISWQGDGIVQIMPGQTSVAVDMAGIYQFTFHYGESCFYTDEVEITQIPPRFSYRILPADTLTCLTRKVALLANTENDNTISWYYHDTLLNMPFAINAGWYHALITDLNGCSTLDSVAVSSDFTKPIAIVTTDTIKCVTNTGNFTIDATTAISWIWQGPGGNIADSLVTNFAASGTYLLYLTGQNGCTDTLPYVLPSDTEFPSLTVIADTITCARPMGTIRIESNLPVSIQWSGNTATGAGDEILTSQPGLFTITATSSQGCISTVQAEMNIDTLAPRLEVELSDTLTCKRPGIFPEVNTENTVSFQWLGGLTPNQLEPQITKAGMYTLQVTAANGCARMATIEAMADFSRPRPIITFQALSCAMPSAPLWIGDNQSNTYVLQYNSESQTINNGHLLDKPGIYQLTAIGDNGCDTTLQFMVTGHFDPPLAEVGDVTLTCSQPVFTFRNLAVNSQSIQYSWWFNDRLSNKDSLQVTDSGIVILTLVDEWGCENIDTAIVFKDFEKPAIHISNDRTILCTADSIWIKLLQPTESASYQWTDSSGQIIHDGQQLALKMAGIYSIHAYNPINGCTSDESFEVWQQGKPEAFDVNIDQALCFGQASYIAINSITGGTAPYLIHLDGQPITIENESAVSPGSHELKITDKNGCILDSQFMILETNPFSVYAGRDTVLQLYGSYTLQPTYILNGNQISAVRWQPHPALSCTDCLQPTVQPKSESAFVIELINQNGCIETDTVTIRVRFDKGVTAPNIIRSSSLSNQRFTLYNRYQSIEIISFLRIYDRWGNLVFIQNNFSDSQPDLGWNGTFMGSEVVPGVYVWVAEIVYKDGSREVLKGDITVVR